MKVKLSDIKSLQTITGFSMAECERELKNHGGDLKKTEVMLGGVIHRYKNPSFTVQGSDTVDARMSDYGPPVENFRDIAAMWSILLNTTVTPKQVCQCMIALKQCREKFKHSPDNLIDIAGYNRIMEIIINDNKEIKAENNDG